MADSKFLTPKDLQQVFQNLTPEQQAQMFEPYQSELSALENSDAHKTHSTALGGMFGALASGINGYQQGGVLKRMQQDALARALARYAQPPAQDAGQPGQGQTGLDAQSASAVANALRSPYSAANFMQDPEENP